MEAKSSLIKPNVTAKRRCTIGELCPCSFITGARIRLKNFSNSIAIRKSTCNGLNIASFPFEMYTFISEDVIEILNKCHESNGHIKMDVQMVGPLGNAALVE